MYWSCCTSFPPKLKECNWKIRSTKVDAGNLKHELLNRLWSILAVNVLSTYWGCSFIALYWCTLLNAVLCWCVLLHICAVYASEVCFTIFILVWCARGSNCNEQKPHTVECTCTDGPQLRYHGLMTTIWLVSPAICWCCEHVYEPMSCLVPLLLFS
jgi:hypothetical protein